MRTLLTLILTALTFTALAHDPADLELYELHVHAMSTNLELEPCPEQPDGYTHCFTTADNIHRLAGLWIAYNHERATPHVADFLNGPQWDTSPAREYAEFQINTLTFSVTMTTDGVILFQLIDPPAAEAAA